jgi:hypothetical protein
VIKMQSALFASVLAAGILVGCAPPFGPPLAAGCTAIGCTAVQATVENSSSRFQRRAFEQPPDATQIGAQSTRTRDGMERER